jgi:hypothetical protein
MVICDKDANAGFGKLHAREGVARNVSSRASGMGFQLIFSSGIHNTVSSIERSLSTVHANGNVALFVAVLQTVTTERH